MATLVKQSLYSGSMMIMSLVVAAGCLAGTASGQAVPTATKSDGLSVFGGASQINPDYGPGKNYGFVFGADFTRHTRLFELSIEPRFGDTSGNAVTEKYFTGNVRFERALGHRDQFHPFGYAGIGYGKFGYGSPVYASDSSVIYTVAGGLDYDITYHFAVRGEYQYQFWDLGYTSNGLTPNGFNVEVVYRIHGFSLFHRH